MSTRRTSAGSASWACWPGRATPRAPSSNPLLDRFEAALQGVPSGRLEVCRALRAEDRGAFEVAFESLVADWEQACAGMALRAEEEATVAAGTQVFVEGLACLRLAEHVGIRTALAFKGCPPLARGPRKRPPIEDPFQF